MRLTECAVVCIVHVNVEETVTEGFESIPTAFATLFEGGNTGKMLVRAKL